MKSDLHLAALPPRPRGGVPRAGVLVLRGRLGDHGAGNTAYRTAYTRRIEASTVPGAACRSGGAARDPGGQPGRVLVCDPPSPPPPPPGFER